jgi:nucleoside-diphosphate-sugar epimerase
VNGRDIQLSSEGTATRSFCYITDAILGMFVALLKGERGKAYNVCNDEACISILELAKTLAGLFPEKKLTVRFSHEKAPTGYLKSPIGRSCLDSSRLRSLGWRPKVGIREGFRRTVLSFIP